MITSRDEALAFSQSNPELQAAYLKYIKALTARAIKRATEAK